MSDSLIPATPAIDLAQAARFFDLLAEGEAVTFQTFDDDASRKDPRLASIVHGDLGDSSAQLSSLNAAGAGVFWMVNFGDGNGRQAANVIGVRALFLDLDGAPLNPVLAAGLEPHAIVESSPGKWHVYWMVSGCAPGQFRAAQRALAVKFGGDMTVCDLPRVLRVPGFLHRKGAPFQSRILSMQPTQAYPFDGLLQGLGLDLSAPVPPLAAPRAEVGTGRILNKVATGGRHEHLRRRVADLNWRGIPEAGIRAAVHQLNELECEPPKAAVDVDALVDDFLRRYVDQHGKDATANGQGASVAGSFVDATASSAEPAVPFFSVVPVADLAYATPAAPTYWWDGYMPAGVVTLLGAHGGAGKSTIALMLAVCIALGLPLFGVPTRRGKVTFFSGEDGADIVRFRLHFICQGLGVDPASLEGRLHVLDATAGEPALFQEISDRGKRMGLTTPSYAAVQEYIEVQGTDVLIVDNASDAFDANEIDRARVRGFMRALACIAHARGGAVLLLAHVDKGTSRGERAGNEGYSGSTAWHNSARSRLYLCRETDGSLLLKQQKHNLGKMAEPLRLTWPEGGIPKVDDPVNGFVQQIADNVDIKVLVRLIHEFEIRGEFVATDTRSRYHAAKVLGERATYPKRRKNSEVFELLGTAERRGWIKRETYRDRSRREAERWSVTPVGMLSVGIAASAASAAGDDVEATSAPAHATAASAASATPGGVGGCAPHDTCALAEI